MEVLKIHGGTWTGSEWSRRWLLRWRFLRSCRRSSSERWWCRLWSCNHEGQTLASDRKWTAQHLDTKHTVSHPKVIVIDKNDFHPVMLTDAGSHVWDVEASGDSYQEVQDQLEVSMSDAGWAVDEETDVYRVVAGFALKTQMFSALHPFLYDFFLNAWNIMCTVLSGDLLAGCSWLL